MLLYCVLYCGECYCTVYCTVGNVTVLCTVLWGLLLYCVLYCGDCYCTVYCTVGNVVHCDAPRPRVQVSTDGVSHSLCIVLYCTVLYCTVLYTALHCHSLNCHALIIENNMTQSWCTCRLQGAPSPGLHHSSITAQQTWKKPFCDL